MKFDHLTEDSLRSLVCAFYERLRRDAELSAIFTAAIGDDWQAHMRKMCDFWATAMRVSRRYHGDMLATHRRLRQLRPELFQRWLALFEQTADEHFTAEPAAALRDRARKTARNLQLALFYRPAEPHGTAPSARSPSGDTGQRIDGPLPWPPRSSRSAGAGHRMSTRSLWARAQAKPAIALDRKGGSYDQQR